MSGKRLGFSIVRSQPRTGSLVQSICIILACLWGLSLSVNAAQPQPVQAGTAAATFAGPLRKSAVNPRYFADASGKVVYLTGSHTWASFQDNGGGYPPPVFNYAQYLTFLDANNLNFFRLWTWEQARWTLETADENYWFNPLGPWQRTGPTNALDGKPKWDLSQFDQSYFDRMRARVVEAGQHGIYVSIMLFDGWSVVSDQAPALNNPWKGHPFNSANNINGLNGDANGDNNGREVHTLTTAAVTAVQDAYVKKVIDTLNDLDNVLYEVSNESPDESLPWQYHMVGLIKNYEAGKAKQHPVGMTGRYEWPVADLLAGGADWISPGGSPYQWDPPAGTGQAVVIVDTDHLWGIGGDRAWVWKTFLRGLNPLFMDGYDGAGYGVGGQGFNFNDPVWVSLRKNLGYTRDYANRINLAAMPPHGELSSTTYALARPTASAAEYLVYAPVGGAFSVNLTAASGQLNVEWFNPATGVKTAGPAVSGGATRTFLAPFSGDAVLYLASAAVVGTVTPTLVPTGTPAGTPIPTSTATPQPTGTAAASPTAPAGTTFPASGVLDNFNRADGLLGSVWGGNTSGYKIAANRLDVGASEDIYWTTSAFGPDQEVFVQFSQIDATGSELGVILKAQTTAGLGSGALIEVAYDPVGKRVMAWTYTPTAKWVRQGVDLPATYVNGDQFGVRMRATGVLEIYRNGLLLGTRTVSGWPYTTGGGYIGLFNTNAANTLLDDFGGGTIGVAGTATATSLPTATTTRSPTATATSAPLATATPTLLPTATATRPPTATSTPLPTATATSAPLATATPTLLPTATATRPPTATAAPLATATATSTPTAVVVFPGTSILDSFDRPNNTSIGANWGGNKSGYKIAANRLDVGSTQDIYWKPTSYGANQEAFVKLITVDPAALEIGVLLKAQSTSGLGKGVLEAYYVPAQQVVRVFTYTSTQGWAQRGVDLPATFSAGDIFGARVFSNGRVEVYRNGQLLGTRDVSSWTYAGRTGYIGIFCYSAANAVLDDFGGGSIAALAATDRAEPPAPETAPSASATLLHVDQTHSWHFADADNTGVYLTGSFDWGDFAAAVEQATPGEPDYSLFLDHVQANHENFVRLWAWEPAPWLGGEMAVPYLRTGAAPAADSNPQYDLDQFDPAYFAQLQGIVDAARVRGIYVSIELFNRNSLAGAGWSNHPLNSANNANGVAGDVDGDGTGNELATLSNAAVVQRQEAYVRRIVETLIDRDNVLYEIDGAVAPDSRAWKIHMLQVVKQQEAALGRQHPVGLNADGDADMAGLLAAGADWLALSGSAAMGSGLNQTGAPQVLTVDESLLPPGDSAWVWRSLLRGLNPITERRAANTEETDGWNELVTTLRNAGAVADQVGIVRFEPHPELCSTTYCSAQIAGAMASYLAYAPAGAGIDLDLSAASSDLRVLWIDGVTGKSSEAGVVTGGQVVAFSPPFTSGAVLYVSNTAMPVTQVYVPFVQR